MTRAIAYIRVSTDEQCVSGLGLEAQQAAIARAVKAEGLDLVATYTEEEGLSGGDDLDKRPALAEALDALGSGSVLLVAKRDRLARDYMLAGYLELEAKRRGATVVSAAGEGSADQSDPSAWLLARIVDVFAHYERLMIKARTSAALKAKRARGERVSGQAPWGYRHEGGMIVPDEHEQASIARALVLHRRGRSIRAIAAQLEQEGYTSRGGGRLGVKVVHRIVKDAA